MHDAPRVDALAIETGSEVFVLVRADVPYFTDGTTGGTRLIRELHGLLDAFGRPRRDRS